MQILAGFSVLAVAGLLIIIYNSGLAEVERSIARWLLRDARGWDSRTLEIERSTAELKDIQ